VQMLGSALRWTWCLEDEAFICFTPAGAWADATLRRPDSTSSFVFGWAHTRRVRASCSVKVARSLLLKIASRSGHCLKIGCVTALMGQFLWHWGGFPPSALAAVDLYEGMSYGLDDRGSIPLRSRNSFRLRVQTRSEIHPGLFLRE